ncbi:NAD(P)-dependent oxidoreductase [Flavobacteriales bacterium]|nr:NAD(P)-dependent oxidoreductase [Flavobacteriales bacterium]
MGKGKPILVVGGAGFVGMSLVSALLESGYTSVFVADIKTPMCELPANAKFVQCDIMSEESVFSLFESCKPRVVYNLAGFASLDKSLEFPKQTLQLNVIGNINILNEAIRCGTELFVYASSAYAMSNKGAFYGISKLTSEKVVEEYAKRNTMSYVVLRYGSIYGPVDFDNNYLYQVIKEAIQSEKIIHHGDGEEIREYVHVHDVSTLSVEVIENRSLWNSCLMLTGSERLKRKDLFNMIKEILDKKNLEIECRSQGYSNHYQFTPYNFQGTAAKKIMANPHVDMGQGILECINDVMHREQNET